MDEDVFRPDTFYQFGALPGGVQNVGLVAIAGLDPKTHAKIARGLRDPFQKSRPTPSQFGRGHRRAGPLADGPVCDPGQRLRARLAGDGQRRSSGIRPRHPRRVATSISSGKPSEQTISTPYFSATGARPRAVIVPGVKKRRFDHRHPLRQDRRPAIRPPPPGSRAG